MCWRQRWEAGSLQRDPELTRWEAHMSSGEETMLHKLTSNWPDLPGCAHSPDGGITRAGCPVAEAGEGRKVEGEAQGWNVGWAKFRITEPHFK